MRDVATSGRHDRCESTTYIQTKQLQLNQHEKGKQWKIQHHFFPHWIKINQNIKYVPLGLEERISSSEEFSWASLIWGDEGVTDIGGAAGVETLGAAE